MLVRIFIVLLLFTSGRLFSVDIQIDSLLTALKIAPENAEKAIIYKAVSDYYAELNPDEAIKYGRLGVYLARKLRDSYSAQQNLFSIGIAYEYKNMLDSALHYYDAAIIEARSRNDKDAVAGLLNSKGIACYLQGDYAAAVSHYDSAMVYWEKTGDLVKQSKTLNNLAIVYRLRKNYNKAIEIYNRSIELKKQLNDSAGLAAGYYNLGRAEYYNNDYQNSIVHFQKSLELYRILNISYEVATAMCGLGESYMALDDFITAERYFTESFPVLKTKLSLDLIMTVMSLSSIDRNNKKPQSALNRLLEYYDYVKDWDRLDSRKAFEKELALTYADLDDYENAFGHLQKFAALTEEVANENRERLAEEMQARFESREKENTIKVQELEIAKNERDKQALFLGSALILMLLGGSIAYGFSKSRNNKRLRLEQQKTESALKDRETLLREIHHRVKNNLQVVSSLLSIQGREITDEKAQQAVTESRNRVRSMALIHQFLYGEQNLSSIDMQQYIAQLGQSLFSTYKVDHDLVELKTEVDQILLDVDTAIPVGLILNELITNALKYAFPDGREGVLFIGLKENNGVLELLVKDNGDGVLEDIPKSSSFGMKLLNAFKQKLEAEYTIQNNNGLEVIYSIKKYKVV
jgi:two-component system, sensor histidine kinase PdtaS